MVSSFIHFNRMSPCVVRVPRSHAISMFVNENMTNNVVSQASIVLNVLISEYNQAL